MSAACPSERRHLHLETRVNPPRTRLPQRRRRPTAECSPAECSDGLPPNTSMSRPLDSARSVMQLQAAPANLIEEAANLRVVAPLEGRGQSIKEGYLKKINSLTSARLYFVLDFETLAWWPDKKDAGPLKEVDGKHRLLLRQIVAVIGTKMASSCRVVSTSE